MKLLFNGENMRLVTENSGYFAMIMSVFNQYERTAPTSGKHNNISHLLQRLLRHLNHVFEIEFPFFLILAHRMCK